VSCEALTYQRTTSFRDGKLALLSNDPIPQRCYILKLFFHREFVESRWWFRNGV